jgi:circadian clock protein KaiC
LSQGADANLADQAALQLLDLAKRKGITVVASSLLANAAPLAEKTPIGISTIADTWMHVSYVSQGGERNRALTIIKSRGTSHSNQVREMVLSSTGVTLADVYAAGGAVLMGTLRWEKENEDRRAKVVARHDAELRRRQGELALAEATARVATVEAEQLLREAELKRLTVQRETLTDRQAAEGSELAERRGADAPRPRRPRAGKGRT